MYKRQYLDDTDKTGGPDGTWKRTYSLDEDGNRVLDPYYPFTTSYGTDPEEDLELGQYLKLGHGEELGGGRQRPSILADATESVFAAVYLDGGVDAARDLIHRVLLDKEQEEQVEERRRDYKTELQELVQRKPDQTLRYEMTGSAGPDHARLFAFRVTLNGEPIGAGEGRSKKEAEQSAARSALKKLQK